MMRRLYSSFIARSALILIALITPQVSVGLDTVTVTGQRIYNTDPVFIYSLPQDLNLGQISITDPVDANVAANRYTTGCTREELVKKAVENAARTNSNLKSTVPTTISQMFQTIPSQVIQEVVDITQNLLMYGGIRDPRYQDTTIWEKLAIIVQGVDYASPAQAAIQSGGVSWYIEVHMWRNKSTLDVQDTKLKNTPEQGCAGYNSAMA